LRNKAGFSEVSYEKLIGLSPRLVSELQRQPSFLIALGLLAALFCPTIPLISQGSLANLYPPSGHAHPTGAGSHEAKRHDHLSA
jgi:hypothetical protein